MQPELELWSDRFQEAGQQAAIAANPEWADRALAWIWGLPIGHLFTADDLTDAVGLPPSRGVTGAVFRQAKERGLVLGRGYGRSVRLSNRGRVLGRWERV